MESLSGALPIIFSIWLVGIIAYQLRWNYSKMKYFVGFLFSLIMLLLSLPAFLVISIIIKLSSKGPVFYYQERVGKKLKPFRMIKFRTMHCNAEKSTGPVWAARFDERIFPFGAFLRTHHLDELPQFINVLKGEMSVIGPRPERPFFVDKFMRLISNYEERLEVTPGITGFAQVLQEYDATVKDVQRKINYDLFYIKKMSLMTDLKIAWYTLRVMVTGILLSGEISEKVRSDVSNEIQDSLYQGLERSPVEPEPSLISLSSSRASSDSGKSLSV